MKRIAFFPLMLFAFNAWSQNYGQDTTELAPVEVRSIRAGNLAPFTKTNLNKQAIERQNLGQDLPFLLNQTPSVIVNSDAGNGVGYTGIRIRGTDASRINVTLNGIPFNDAESQGSFFVNLPDFSSSVNSIQVQRGVGTSSNGAGSFGATINLSTNELNTKAYAEASNSYGSFNTWKNTIKLGTGLIGDHFTTDLRLSNITSDGYIDRATSDLKSYYLSSAYVSDKTTVRLNIFSGKEKTYQAWYGVSEEDLKTNRTINYAGMEKPGAPYDNETDNYNQSHYQLFFNQHINPNLTFNTGVFYVRGKGYYEQYKADESYMKYGLPNQVRGTDTTTNSDFIRQLWLDNHYFGDVFSLLYESGKTQLTFGGAITKYIGNHYGDVIWAKEGMSDPKHRWYDLDAWKNDASAYAKWQQEVLPGFRFYTDLQFRKVGYEVNGFRDNPDLHINKKYNFFNPKAGVSYYNNGMLAYASYSIGKKEPNRDDFEAGLTQVPKPERLRDLEVGIEKKEKQYSVGATFYYMHYKDQLVLTGKVNDVGAYTRTNIDNSYRAGIELQAAAVLASWLQLSGNLTLSRNKVLDFKEYVDDWDNGDQKINTYSKTDIAFSPNTIGAATVKLIPAKSLEIDLLSKYVGKQFLDNTGSVAKRLEDYFTEDVRVIYSFGHRSLKNVSLIAQANNIFNKKYSANGYTYSYLENKKLITKNYYYPMAGFNWMFGVNVKF